MASYGGTLAAFAIPVSSEVVEQIQNDPVYQHKLVLAPKKDPIVAPNTLCEGKRAQVPAKNCNNFLNCWDGWAFEQECPEGLLFSREGYCDYADNVDCSNREILHKPEGPKPQPVQPVIPLPPAQVPQPPSQPQLPAQPHPPIQSPAQPQPPSLPHPPVQPQPPPQPTPIQPQPPQPAPCQHPQPQPPQPQPPQPQPPQPQPPQPQPQPPQQIYPQQMCSQDFESFINKYNCNEFFVCVNRQPVKFQCPADLAYSEYLGVCDYPDRVGCVASTLPPSMRGSASSPPPAAAISTKPAFISPELFVNYQSHMSGSKIAMSRQDAIRQLQGIK
ncbi:hypothetical protein O3G_MSEX010105 [Manduca sexta]|uniref:Chitin-binding type-2 domain-containing protein n=2 Tax=Manduca sexta TaxID=7130 RepID=A0A921ZFP7_MANSE|nr:hypothetical protein O3G_MSEX010105 [Manduca sexta]